MKNRKKDTTTTHNNDNDDEKRELLNNDEIRIPMRIVLVIIFLCILFTAFVCLFLVPLVMHIANTANLRGYQPDYSLPWLEDLENEIYRNDPPPQKNKAKMRMLWQTPLMVLNINSANSNKFGINNVTKFNTLLAATVLHQYNRLIEANPSRLTKGGHEYDGANQAFYDWQMRSGGWDIMSQQPEVQKLLSIFQSATDQFLQAIGQDHNFILHRSRAIQAWATVHESCIMHLPHTHPKQIVSGVYYVKVPDNAGSIIFDDPRGPLPPFDNRVTIQPKQGDLILFPSWLIHSVNPTPGSTPRISIPFNIEGEWEATTGIENAFNIDY